MTDKIRLARGSLAAVVCGCLVFLLVCGMIPSAIAAAADHTCVPGDKTIEDVIEPTCQKEGSYNEVTRCAVCNKILSSKSVTVKKLSVHSWDGGVVTKSPTRTDEGEILYSCTVEGCTATKTDAVPAVPFLLGDVNADGKVTPQDARLTLRYAVGLGEEDGVIAGDETDDSFKAADYDSSGVIGAADARLILRVSVGLED